MVIHLYRFQSLPELSRSQKTKRFYPSSSLDLSTASSRRSYSRPSHHQNLSSKPRCVIFSSLFPLHPVIASCGTTTARRLHAAAYFVASLLPHATSLLQLLVAGRVSLQAGGSSAASAVPAAAGLKLDLQHARPGLGARSQGAKPSTILPSPSPS